MNEITPSQPPPVQDNIAGVGRRDGNIPVDIPSDFPLSGTGSSFISSAMARRALIALYYHGYEYDKARSTLGLSRGDYEALLNSDESKKLISEGWKPSLDDTDVIAFLSYEARYSKRATSRIKALNLLMQHKGLLQSTNQVNIQINNPFSAYKK